MEIKKQSLLTLPLESSDERTWYIAFCENETQLPWWMNIFLINSPKHITHTYCFSQAGDNVLFVEPTMSKVNFSVKQAPACAASIAQEIADYGHIVVRHTFTPDITFAKSIWNLIPSCVTVVKIATGFGSNSWTPRGLLHDLISKGAHVFLAGE